MIEFGHGTHVGLRRDHNEDTYSAEPSIGLWLVADGMGGHDHGEVASAIARDAVVDEIRAGKDLDAAIRSASEKILTFSAERNSESALPMGTTLAAALIQDDQYEIAWVGDSRVYIFANGDDLQQLTSDHSYVQELVDQGAISAEQARFHPHRNVVTQALGITEPDALRIGKARGALNANDQLLLCSDGLTEEVDDQQIEQILGEKYLPQECVDHLILAALDNGGSDNITVLVVGDADDQDSD